MLLCTWLWEWIWCEVGAATLLELAPRVVAAKFVLNTGTLFPRTSPVLASEIVAVPTWCSFSVWECSGSFRKDVVSALAAARISAVPMLWRSIFVVYWKKRFEKKRDCARLKTSKLLSKHVREIERLKMRGWNFYVVFSVLRKIARKRITHNDHSDWNVTWIHQLQNNKTTTDKILKWN